MYTQRVGVFKYRISLRSGKEKIFVNEWLPMINETMKIGKMLKRFTKKDVAFAY